MTLMGMKLEKATLANLIISILLLITFLALPLISIMNFYSGTAANLFINFNDWMATVTTYGFDVSEFSDFRFFLALFYIIPVFLIISYGFLFIKKDQKWFNRIMLIDYIVTLLLLIAVFIMRMMFISGVEEGLGEVGLGLLSLGGLSSRDLLSLSFGYYVMVVLSIAGIICTFISPGSKKENVQPRIVDIQPSPQPENRQVNASESERQPAGLQKRPKNVVPEKTLALSGPVNKLVVNSFPSYVIKENDNTLRFVHESHPDPDKLIINTYEGDYFLNSSVPNRIYLGSDPLDPENFYEVQNGEVIRFGNELITVEIEGKSAPVFDNPSNQSPSSNRNSEPIVISEANVREEFEPFPDGNYSDKTVVLGKDRNKTIKLNYNGGTTEFPIMSLVSNNNDVVIINKTPFIVGYDPSRVDYQLNETGISKQHFLIERVHDNFYIRDLGSTNGTKINGVDIFADKPFSLRVGDVIEVGNLEFTFEDA